MVGAEVDESGEVDGGAAVREADLVAGDSAESDFAVAADHPCDGPFDHRPVLPVDVLERGSGGLESEILDTGPKASLCWPREHLAVGPFRV